MRIILPFCIAFITLNSCSNKWGEALQPMPECARYNTGIMSFKNNTLKDVILSIDTHETTVKATGTCSVKIPADQEISYAARQVKGKGKRLKWKGVAFVPSCGQSALVFYPTN